MKKLLAVLVLAMMLTPLATRAQSPAVAGNGLQISPSIIELRADPGETIETTIRVRNVTADAVLAITEVNDFVAEDENGTPSFIFEDDKSEPNPFGLKDYISSVNQVALESLEQKVVTVTIAIPEDANPGGHYAVVRFTAIPANQTNNQGQLSAQLSASVGTLILVNVEGEVTESLKVLEFGAARFDTTDGVIIDKGIKSWFRRGPLAVVARIENSGNSHVKPIANITLKNMLGNEVSSVELNNPPRNVLPNSTRKFVNQLPDKFYFGKYTLETSIAYGQGGGNIITTSATFWVIPYDLIAILLAVLVGIFFGARTFKRSYDKKLIAKARRSDR